MMILDSILTSLIYLVEAFALFMIGKFIYDQFHRNIKVNHELVEKDNLAFAISLTGYFIGLTLVIGGAIVGPSYGLWEDLLMIGVYGILGIVLLNLAAILNDKLLLSQFKVHKEIIEDQNVGTGVVEAANFIATGLIVYGAIVGEGGGIITALVLWVFGQAILLVVGKVYDAITPYKIHDLIEKDNIPVGIGFAGALIAVANLIRAGFEADFDGWFDHLINVGVDTGLGLLLLPILRYFTDKVLLPGRSINDEIANQEHPNVGAGLIEAFAYVGGSVLLAWCL